MKKLLLASAATVALLSVGSAFAADLPSRKAPPAAPPAPMWTGFYAGLNAGYAWGTNNNTGNLSGAAPYSNIGGAYDGSIAGPALSGYAGNTQSGFIGGAQFGYNYQGFMSQNLVLGLETDISGTGIRSTGASKGFAQGEGRDVFGLGTAPAAATGSTVVNSGLDYLGTVRGRVGYLFTPTMLLYGTAGFAYGGAYAQVAQSAYETQSFVGLDPYTSSSVTGMAGSTFTGGGATNQLLTGWTAGGGVEWMFLPNWSLKGEALYYNLGNLNVNTVAYAPAANGFTANNIAWGRSNVNFQGVIARAGINYHFNWGSAPVVAAF